MPHGLHFSASFGQLWWIGLWSLSSWPFGPDKTWLHQICIIFFWLGLDNVDHGQQLSALNALEKVTDLGAMVYSTVAVICKALHDDMLFLMLCDVLIPIPPFFLTIIVKNLQLSFSICGLPDHMVSTKKFLMDVKVHYLTILHTLLLLHVYICIHVCEDLGDKGTVDLECITFAIWINQSNVF